MSDIEKTKVLVLVMTYPLPSRGYQELVCTAGITEAGEWVRLYPIDYRYRPLDQQFKKYQWIEVELDPKGAGKDHRKESRRPVLESIKILGERLSTKDGWKERRAIIDKMPHRTRKQLTHGLCSAFFILQSRLPRCNRRCSTSIEHLSEVIHIVAMFLHGGMVHQC